MMRFTTKILPSRSSNVGLIGLNNPKAFHALDLEMIRALTDFLSTWQSDSSIKATVFSGSSQSKKKSFCSGGDVKSVYLSGVQKDNRMSEDRQGAHSTLETPKHGFGEKNLYTADFFREEYQLNYLIATKKKNLPQISLWDGIVMGGGVGISIHGKYRVATENTLFAMPETGIGFFPDVGSTYWYGIIRRKKCLNVAECLKMEYRISQRFMRKDSDFYEGIRAVLVDKDQSPKWEPVVLEDVSNERVASYFNSLSENDLCLDDTDIDEIIKPRL